MTIPKISIILPVYNAQANLRQTVESIRQQTLTHFQLVAIDDGSSDDSLSVLLDQAAKDSRIKVISRSNGGVSSARNLGVELSSAPLIAFMDADDLWDARKLERHLAVHRARPSMAASYAQIAFIDPDAVDLDSATTQSRLGPQPLNLMDVLAENPVCTASNLVIRRDWFVKSGGFDESLSFAEDQDLIAKLISHGGQIIGINEILTGYRFSENGLSMNLDKMHQGWRKIASRYTQGAALNALDAVYCRYLARRVLRAGGKPMTAFHYAMEGLRKDAVAFFAQRRRGFALLLALIAYPLLPSIVSRRLFA